MKINLSIIVALLIVISCASHPSGATSPIDDHRASVCGEWANRDPDRCSALLFAISIRESFVSGNKQVILEVIEEYPNPELLYYMFGDEENLDCLEEVVVNFLFFCSQEDVLYYVERLNERIDSSRNQFRLYFLPHTGTAVSKLPPTGYYFEQYISTVAELNGDKWFLPDPFEFSAHR